MKAAVSVVALVVLAAVGCDGFAIRPASPALAAPRSAALCRPAGGRVVVPPLRMSDAPDPIDSSSRNRLGSSVDQDGKSNIWAVEPKMQVEDEDNTGKLVAVGIGAVVAFGLIASSFLFINVEQ
mmetsp:Transcript_16244/g.65615  ORF Transcript_16244/g.65615 Transcript_16244/m.65615 type:complete len:124 (+) Transcript_16244:87-458(+)